MATQMYIAIQNEQPHKLFYPSVNCTSNFLFDSLFTQIAQLVLTTTGIDYI